MNKPWISSILAVALVLLSILKAHEVQSLQRFFKPERSIKLQKFTEARSKVEKEDLDLLKLWESMLTGRSAPLSRLMKSRYQALGLNHLFTPSGFHLSAAVFPFIKLTNPKYHLLIMIILGCLFMFLPGLGALKRMLSIKAHQKVLGMHAGFICALLMDMLFGTFQNGALSFTYSFLFLGIIYSGIKGLALIIWFFIAQIILAYFQNSDVSPLLLLFSPILNFGFGILMPILFLLSIPLWDWQLSIGIYLLKLLQNLVDTFSGVIFDLPLIEVHIVTLILTGFILFRKKKLIILALFFISSSLNLDRAKAPGLSSYEFVPKNINKTVYTEKLVTVYFEDGKCRLNLVRGHWYENCSPKRRSSRNKKLKKLSYRS